MQSHSLFKFLSTLKNFLDELETSLLHIASYIYFQADDQHHLSPAHIYFSVQNPYKLIICSQTQLNKHDYSCFELIILTLVNVTVEPSFYI